MHQKMREKKSRVERKGTKMAHHCKTCFTENLHYYKMGFLEDTDIYNWSDYDDDYFY